MCMDAFVWVGWVLAGMVQAAQTTPKELIQRMDEAGACRAAIVTRLECSIEEAETTADNHVNKVTRSKGTTELRYDGSQYDANAFERIDVLTHLSRVTIVDGNEQKPDPPRLQRVIWDGNCFFSDHRFKDANMTAL